MANGTHKERRHCKCRSRRRAGGTDASSRAAANGSRVIPHSLERRALSPIAASHPSRGTLQNFESPPIMSDSHLGHAAAAAAGGEKKSTRIRVQNNTKVAALGRSVRKLRAREVGVFSALARRSPAAVACYMIYLTYFRDELDIDIYRTDS